MHSEYRSLRARKNHRCLWCGERIDKGSEYVIECYVDGNHHSRNRFHTECYKAIQQAPHDLIEDWNDEGCVPDFERGHIHEVGSDTRQREAERGCNACLLYDWVVI